MKYLKLLLLLSLPMSLLAQVNVQKTQGTNAVSNGPIVIGSGITLSTSGTGGIVTGNAVITGGSINNVAINTTTPNAGSFTTLNSSGVTQLATGGGNTTTGGNLGVGVTPSTWAGASTWHAIEVNYKGTGIASDGYDNLGIASNAYYNSGWYYGTTGYANFVANGNASGSFGWYTAPSGTAGAGISFTNVMNLSNAGVLSIPSTASSSSTSTGALVVGNGSSGGLGVGGAGNFGGNLYTAGNFTSASSGSFGNGATGTPIDIQINGGSTGTNGAYVLGQAAGSNEWIVGSSRTITGGGALGLDAFVYGNNPFRVWTNSSERMRIDGAGNVGIGVTPNPVYASSGSIGGALQGDSWTISGYAGKETTYYATNAYTSAYISGWKYRISAGGATRYDQYVSTHSFYTAPSGTAGNAITWTDQMDIGTGGVVVNNTTSSTTTTSGALQVAGGVGVGGNGWFGGYVACNSLVNSGNLNFFPTGTAYVLDGTTGSDLVFNMSNTGYNDTTALTISHNGNLYAYHNVGIGTTSPSSKLSVTNGNVSGFTDGNDVTATIGAGSLHSVVASSAYDGLWIGANNIDGGVLNPTLHSWAIDLGGRNALSNSADSFTIFRSPDGSSGQSKMFSIDSNANLGTFGNNIYFGQNTSDNYIKGYANGPYINIHPNGGAGGVSNRFGALGFVDNNGNISGTAIKWDEQSIVYLPQTVQSTSYSTGTLIVGTSGSSGSGSGSGGLGVYGNIYTGGLIYNQSGLYYGSGSSCANYWLPSSGTNVYQINQTVGSNYIWYTSNSTTSDTQAMTLSTGGQLTLNTYGVTGFTVTQQTNGGYGYRCNALALGGAYYYAGLYANGTFTGQIVSTDGSTTQYQTSSDARLKTNFHDWSLGDKFDQLPIGEFNWLKDGSIGHGTLAQEMYKVYPDAVVKGDDAPTLDSNKQGATWGVDYGKLTVPVIAEVKALRARVKTLEQEQADTQKQLNDLTAKFNQYISTHP